MKRAPQAHSETREMRPRPPHLKKWEPGTGKGFDAFTDIYALALRDRGVGAGGSRQWPFYPGLLCAFISFGIYIGYTAVGVGVA